ncbi:MAG: bifunctional DNA primase/polymerase [Candidatus Paceibacterota bacterium]
MTDMPPAQTDPIEETLERTSQYISWGFVPLPLTPGEKRPFGVRWQRTTMSEARSKVLSAMEKTGWKGLNLGVLCGKASGVVVLDIDAKKGGLERWKAATARFGAPHTFTVQTGGGGLHLYFRYDEETAFLKTSFDTLGPGWDIRSEGGQVVGPYSIHPETKKPYSILTCFDERYEPYGKPIISPMPRWIYDPIGVMAAVADDGVAASGRSDQMPLPTVSHLPATWQMCTVM